MWYVVGIDNLTTYPSILTFTNMRRYIYHYLLLCVLLATSCKETEEAVLHESLVGSPVELDNSNNTKFSRLLFGNILISEGFHKSGYYGNVIIGNKIGEPDSLFTIGNGHNEFQSLAFAKGINNSLCLLNYPNTANKLLACIVIDSTKNINAIKDDTHWKKYSLEKIPATMFVSDHFVVLSDSVLLIAGAPVDAIGHIMSLVNYKNQTIQPLDFWPDDGVKCDSLPKHGIYTHYCQLQGNNKGRFIYVCGRERYAFIFSIEGNRINVIKDLYTIYSDYKSDRSKLNYITKTRTAEEVRCASNDKNIYSLLVECDKNGNKREKWNPFLFGNTIEVFDWDGKKQRVIHLDNYGQRIFVSEDNKTLYLFNDDYDEGSPKIWIYKLNN